MVFAEYAGETEPSEEIAAQIRRAILSACGVLPAAIRFLPRGFLVKSTSGKMARAESIRKIRLELFVAGR